MPYCSAVVVTLTFVYVFRETLVLGLALLVELTIHMSRVIQVFSLQKSLATELQQLMVV